MTNPDVVPEKATAEGTSGDAPLLVWRSHPAAERPLVTALVAAIIALTVVGVWLFLLNVWMTAILGFLFVGSLGSFFLPTTFRLTESGVQIEGTVTTRRRPWSSFRSYYTERWGVLLSPYPAPRRMENFRGVFLRFSGNRDAVLAVVGERVSKQ
jgi:hypothetical protein